MSLPEPTRETAVTAIKCDPATFEPSYDTSMHKLATLLQAYATGEDVDLDGIAIDETSWTPYTRRARDACRKIPRGETRTYAWLAERASGSRMSARAAGRAMATNPVPIIIPCHRVVGSDGNLHGFGGSIGLPLKSRLLALEQTCEISALGS